MEDFGEGKLGIAFIHKVKVSTVENFSHWSNWTIAGELGQNDSDKERILFILALFKREAGHLILKWNIKQIFHIKWKTFSEGEGER